jgi:hypothetical protein
MTQNNPSAKHDACCSEDHTAEPQAIEAAIVNEKVIMSMDNLGIIASAVCLVHCLAFPFLIALLPVLGLQFLDTHESHLVIGGFIWLFAMFAIVPGYLKHKKLPILIGTIAGLALVTFGVLAGHQVLGEHGEISCLIAGNLTLVATHWKNRAMCKCEH